MTFGMKDLGKGSFVLDIEIYIKKSHGLFDLSQKAYIDRVLKIFNVSNYSPSDVPISKRDKFSNSLCLQNYLRREAMNLISYASDVNSLIYAQVTLAQI